MLMTVVARSTTNVNYTNTEKLESNPPLYGCIQDCVTLCR